MASAPNAVPSAYVDGNDAELPGEREARSVACPVACVACDTGSCVADDRGADIESVGEDERLMSENVSAASADAMVRSAGNNSRRSTLRKK